MLDMDCIFQKYFPKDVVVVRAPKGRTIFMPYQRAEHVFHIHSGIAGTLALQSEGKEVLSKIYLPNHLFGLAGLVGMYSNKYALYIGEGRAITPVTYCKVRREFVSELLDDRKARATVFDMICSEASVNSTTGPNIEKIGIPRKVFILLNILAGSIGIANHNGKKALQGITHNDIAFMLNSTRPTITRAISKLEKEGFVKVNNRKIVILRPYSLLKSMYF